MLVSPFCFCYYRNRKTMINCSFENKKTIPSLIALAGVLLTVWVGVDISDKLKRIGNLPAANTIVVSATNDVYAKPDLAITTVSVATEAKTVAQAMSENTVKMNAVIAAVKNQGVEDKDLKTVNFNISPRYEWENPNCNYSYCPSGKRILAGYDINQSLEVKIRDLAKIGGIIEGATGAGANEVGGLQFTIDNEDLLKEEARNNAIEEAKNKAKNLAEKLGIRLVKIVSFSESGSFPIPYYAGAAKEALGIGGAAPDIQTGENKISVTVSLTYQIR